MTDEMTTGPRPGRKTDRESPRRRPTLAEPEIIAEQKKNRAGDLWRVTLTTFENVNLIDLRTYYSDAGYRRPGKGFCAHVRHLPRLSEAINDTLAKARELGLVDDA